MPVDLPEQSLRQVTVLFLDVVESTRFSRGLDPEDIHSVMDGALDRFTAIVEGQGGKVLQYAGDSLLAVFGADKVQEDDAERAVHAGLALLAEARARGAEIQHGYGHEGFDVRIGVHTGPVLLGGGVRGEPSVRGITVNIAARLEQSAPAGMLRISHDTYRLVRGAFDLTSTPPTSLKGLAEPIRSYLVEGAKREGVRGHGRGLDGPQTPLIGRAAELKRLSDAYEAVVEDRRIAIVSLVGDPGLGKSRLLLEFERWLERRPGLVWFFHGRARPHSQSVPYGMLRAMLWSRFEILDSDSQAAAQAKLTEGFGTLFGERAEEQCALIGELIGLDYGDSPHIAGISQDAHQIRNRAFHAGAQYFRLLHESNGAPIVVLLDDVHWADDGSLDFVSHLLQVIRHVPMMVLCLARPTLYERRPLWGSGHDGHERIDLAPMSRRSSRELANAMLGRLDPVPPALRDLLAASAEGNPYFVEELIGMLIDDGVIVTHTAGDPERWRLVPERLLTIRVPPTLAGVLQARLDSLPPAEKVALQQASVIGHIFWDEALQRIDPVAIEALDALIHRELARERETGAFAGVREYAFKHHLLHQVTYESVLKRHKMEQHRRTAEWLVARSGERAQEHDGLIADHYERAGDAVNALLYLRRAGEHAVKTFANSAALDYLGRALSLVPEGDAETRYALTRVQVRVLTRLGRRLDQAAAIARLMSCAEALNDDAKRAQALGQRAQYEAETGDSAAACATAARAISLADAAGRPEAALGARLELSNILQDRGDRSAAIREAERCLTLSRAVGDRFGESAALNQVAIAAARSGRSSAARGYAEEALRVCRDLGDKSVECVVLCNLGTNEAEIGNFDVAVRRVREGLRVARDIGWRLLERNLLCTLSAVMLSGAGGPEEALSLARQGSAIELEFADRRSYAWTRCAEGRAHAAMGNLTEAIPCYLDALSIFREVPSVSGRTNALAGLAHSEALLGRRDDAMAHVSEALQCLDSPQTDESIDDLAWVCFSCHECLHALADPRAGQLLHRAYELVTQRSSLLDSADRDVFLSNVPLNRAIQAKWAESRPSKGHDPA